MDSYVLLAVNGTLMRGFELECNMIAANAVFQYTAETEWAYRMWSIDDKYPAMIRTSYANHLANYISVEVWAVPKENLADLLLKEPEGLSIGKVKLDSGKTVLGVLAEPELVVGMKEITHIGCWKAYSESLI